MSTKCDACARPAVYWCSCCSTHHGPSSEFAAHKAVAA